MGNVEKTVVASTAHLVMFEDVRTSAEVLVAWLKKQMQSSTKNEEFHRTHQTGKSSHKMLSMSKQWLEGIKRKRDAKRPIRGNL